MLMVVEIRVDRFPGLTHVERSWQIQIAIALSSSAMQESAVPQPDEHTSMELGDSATDAGAQDAAAATAAAALATFAAEIAASGQ